MQLPREAIEEFRTGLATIRDDYDVPGDFPPDVLAAAARTSAGKSPGTSKSSRRAANPSRKSASVSCGSSISAGRGRPTAGHP